MMSESLREKYQKLFYRLMIVLPMDDIMFLASLISANLLPSESRTAISARPTTVEKAAEFLRRCIEPGFSEDDNSNDLFDELLEKMEESSSLPAKQLAIEIKGNCKCMTAYT